ncbi:condensation domain-containing protein [Streptomyces chattanoogensis]|uniref:Condensation domain-containing protein n=1 Tax=Streptomyces chattanoogensis TaxID=66876 RepID=A0A0N0XUA9_9ACTN|nr:condensation domain-containing protein [Streptomyces chattanoogensis]KPC60637.1 hypothetical protein ADL29_28375 [Streptomyces chattanoogensis]
MTDPQHSWQQASSPERQFWFAEQIAPGSRANCAVGHIRMDGPLNLPALTAATHTVVLRHEALRTAFVQNGRELRRHVLAAPPVRPPVVLPAGTGFAQAAELLLANRFDIGAGDVHRTAVAPDEDGAAFFLAVHHVAFDGLSHEIYTQDLARAYACETGAADRAAPPVRRSAPVSPDAARHAELRAHWLQALADVPDLPAGGRDMSQRDLARATVAERRTVLSAATVAALRERARQHAVSAFGLVLAAYGQALSELTGADDFCVGTPVSVRSAGDEDEVGCVLNTVPVRLRGLAGPDVIERVWAAVVDGLVNLDLPCDEIIRVCRPHRTRRMPLFQALFAFQSWPRTVHSAGAARFRTVPVQPVGSQAEIQMQVHETGEDTFEGVLQAPESGSWADRLDAFLRSFHHHLDLLLTEPPKESPR